MELYQVKSGDSLSRIARDVLGDMNRWREIATLNSLVAPFVIQPGDELVIPEAPSAVDAVDTDAGVDVGSNTMIFLAIGAVLLLVLGRTQ